MEVHIGKEIEKKFQESGLKLGAFAERINTGERNVYSIFGRKDISAEMLTSISTALDYNFFQFYERELKSILKEPAPGYNKNQSHISLTITLSATPEDYYNHFSQFLKAMVTQAQTFGFKIR
jgi:hypothetical protein